MGCRVSHWPTHRRIGVGIVCRLNGRKTGAETALSWCWMSSARRDIVIVQFSCDVGTVVSYQLQLRSASFGHSFQYKTCSWTGC